MRKQLAPGLFGTVLNNGVPVEPKDLQEGIYTVRVESDSVHVALATYNHESGRFQFVEPVDGVTSLEFETTVRRDGNRISVNYQQEHVKAVIATPGGALTSNSVNLYGAHSGAYLKFTQTQEDTAHRDAEGNVKLPKLSKWETLQAFIEAHPEMVGGLDSLPSLPEPEPATAQ